MVDGQRWAYECKMYKTMQNKLPFRTEILSNWAWVPPKKNFEMEISPLISAYLLTAPSAKHSVYDLL